MRRTKIVATLGPASHSPEMIRQLILAGVDVARLNFSHGTHEEHARTIATLRAIAAELASPVTLLQDLQGPKIRVGALPGGEMLLEEGSPVALVPEADFHGQPAVIPLDYAEAAQETRPGQRVLLADGAFELEVVSVVGSALHARVLQGGRLGSRKGVNFPALSLPGLPSLTEKDRADLAFGLAQGMDWISLSFVRRAQDLRELKEIMAAGPWPSRPVIAKIEKPQAVENLEEILAEADGVMVARGDLGVELPPERVPLLQKQIIDACNRRGLPVITATQMLESMVTNPRPTRAESSDVANAIIDGTDAVMLSAESAVGAFPVRSVQTMDRIAREIEAALPFKTSPVPARDDERALCEAAASMGRSLDLHAIVALTTTGHTAHALAAQRPRAPIFAITTDTEVYHALNLRWGLKPLLVEADPATFEDLVQLAEGTLKRKQLAVSGDRILVIGGVPVGRPHGSNFVKLHTLA